MYVVHPSLSQKCVACAWLQRDAFNAGQECARRKKTYVTPLPNQECVSSCTTTSTYNVRKRICELATMKGDVSYQGTVSGEQS